MKYASQAGGFRLADLSIGRSPRFGVLSAASGEGPPTPPQTPPEPDDPDGPTPIQEPPGPIPVPPEPGPPPMQVSA